MATGVRFGILTMIMVGNENLAGDKAMVANRHILNRGDMHIIVHLDIMTNGDRDDVGIGKSIEPQSHPSGEIRAPTHMAGASNIGGHTDDACPGVEDFGVYQVTD